MKIYMHEHLTHEYFYTRKYPDLRYTQLYNNNTVVVTLI